MSSDETPESERPRAAKEKVAGWKLWARDIAIFAVIFVAFSAWKKRDLLDKRQEAPAFTLMSIEGEEISLSDFEGQTVQLHFWATWCAVCKREIPSVKGVHNNLAEDEVLLTIVDPSDDLETLRAFAEERDLEYPILLGTREVLEAYHVSAFPTNYYVDRRGRIAGTSLGLSTRLGMEAQQGCAR